VSVLGVVPAAGRSTRIGGGPKPLLETGAGTFLERVVATLREGGADRVVVGVRDDSGPVAATARRAGAEVLVPTDVETGPIATVRAALAGPLERSEVDAALLLPADFPLVRKETVDALLRRWRAGGGDLLLPRQGGRTGHPALFAGPLLHELLEPGLPEGARSVVERHRERAVEVEVEDPGIHVDVDTLPDYRRHFPDAYRKRFQKW
jgi:molybdenum cofactor cytidylyltransferase